MANINGSMFVCECCALAIANGDTSACEHYWEHSHTPLAELPGLAVLTGRESVLWNGAPWVCDGCGSVDNIAGSVMYGADLT